jgi:hypothetical protein
VHINLGNLFEVSDLTHVEFLVQFSGSNTCIPLPDFMNARIYVVHFYFVRFPSLAEELSLSR